MADKNTRKLAKTPGIWRVDGFGEISNLAGKRPQIEVCFSKVIQNKKSSALQNSSLTGDNLILRYSMVALRRFPIGSLWENGKCISKVQKIEKSFTIDTSRVRLVRLNEKVELNAMTVKYVIPPLYYRFGENWAALENNFVTLVPVINDPRTDWMVLPCSELFKFYLGVSDRFCNALLMSKLESYVDWNKSNPSNHSPKLSIKRKLSLVESFTLLRALATEQGMNCLTAPRRFLSTINIRNATRSNATTKSPLVLKSLFPFEGITTLSVAGKKMPFKNSVSEEWGVFAMNILHCNYPC